MDAAQRKAARRRAVISFVAAGVLVLVSVAGLLWIDDGPGRHVRDRAPLPGWERGSSQRWPSGDARHDGWDAGSAGRVPGGHRVWDDDDAGDLDGPADRDGDRDRRRDRAGMPAGDPRGGDDTPAEVPDPNPPASPPSTDLPPSSGN